MIYVSKVSMFPRLKSPVSNIENANKSSYVEIFETEFPGTKTPIWYYYGWIRQLDIEFGQNCFRLSNSHVVSMTWIFINIYISQACERGSDNGMS